MGIYIYLIKFTLIKQFSEKIIDINELNISYTYFSLTNSIIVHFRRERHRLGVVRRIILKWILKK